MPRGSIALFHYSPFAYGTRGFPLLAAFLPALRSRRLSGTTVVVLHELAFRVGGSGPRVKERLWQWWQGWCLRIVLVGAQGAVVTTEERARLVASLRPRLPVLLQPVWSALPDPLRTPASGGEGDDAAMNVGIFGWGAFPAEAPVAVDAMMLLEQRIGRSVRLTLIGGDVNGGAAWTWRQAADKAGLGDRLVFTGRVEAATAAVLLSSLHIYLHPDQAGPAARKTSLAAALQAGLPVVAFEGPETWSALVREQVVRLSLPAAPALAVALAQAFDDDRDDAAAARRRRFYDVEMSRCVGAARYAEFLKGLA